MSAGSISRDEARGLAIRVEDAKKVLEAILESMEPQMPQGDYKSRVACLLARGHIRNLEHVVKRLRSVP